MRRQDFLKCLKLARSEAALPPYLSLTMFDSKNRVAATSKEFAALIRGQCLTLNGEWLHNEESELEQFSKKIDLVG